MSATLSITEPFARVRGTRSPIAGLKAYRYVRLHTLSMRREGPWARLARGKLFCARSSGSGGRMAGAKPWEVYWHRVLAGGGC